MLCPNIIGLTKSAETFSSEINERNPKKTDITLTAQRRQNAHDFYTNRGHHQINQKMLQQQ